MKHKRWNHGTVHDQLVQLAAGELGPLRSWWLQRRIAREPAVSQEWEEVRGLWSDLRALQTTEAVPSRPVWPDATPQAFRPIPVRRLRRGWAVAAGLAALLTLTGAMAGRLMKDWGANAGFTDRFGRGWYLSGDFLGKTQVFDADGKLAGTWDVDAGNPNGQRSVKVEGVRHELRGPGRHEIRDAAGQLLGSVVLQPATAEDLQRQEREREQMVLHWQRLFTGKADLGNAPSVGLIVGNPRYPQVSWVLVGYASVKATYYGGKEPVRETTASKRPEELPWESAPAQYQSFFERLRALFPPRDAEPQIRWAIPKQTEGRYSSAGIWNDTTGDTAPSVVPVEGVSPIPDRWVEVESRGTASGYGKHEVRDRNGTLLLELEVTPLPPAQK